MLPFPDMDAAIAIGQAAHDPRICAALLRDIERILDGRQMRFMEVCGTHTAAIFQSGLRSLLPENITHLSGPGCPVCVTHEAEVALFLELAATPGFLIATFGDLLRVPGPDGQSLKHIKASGGNIKVVYSPLDALELAKLNPGMQVVFPGIGFETTAPAVAAAVIAAKKANVCNFSVLSLHKLVGPALRAILDSGDTGIDVFLLPGHVATITGLGPFRFIAENYGRPGVVGGFEPTDLLLALKAMARLLADGSARIENAYPRAVAEEGNPKAQELMRGVFRTVDAKWRGLETIAKSGLAMRSEFRDFDAMAKFQLTLPETAPVRGCRCGDILKGSAMPPQCPLFAKKCTPASPVGPCMVSTEGSCAAWHKYHMV